MNKIDILIKGFEIGTGKEPIQAAICLAAESAKIAIEVSNNLCENCVFGKNVCESFNENKSPYIESNTIGYSTIIVKCSEFKIK